MSRMELLSTAREMQRVATKLPLARAPKYGSTDEKRFFRQVSPAITWGLTLNK